MPLQRALSGGRSAAATGLDGLAADQATGTVRAYGGLNKLSNERRRPRPHSPAAWVGVRYRPRHHPSSSSPPWSSHWPGSMRDALIQAQAAAAWGRVGWIRSRIQKRRPSPNHGEGASRLGRRRSASSTHFHPAGFLLPASSKGAGGRTGFIGFCFIFRPRSFLTSLGFVYLFYTN